MTSTLYHNPACSTSRKALALLQEKGAPVEVVEYLKTGWTEKVLRGILKAMGNPPASALLRTRGGRAEELGLTAPGATDAQLIQAFIDEPVLVERPILVTDKGARVCRPVEAALELL